jgi:hypothetical protein
MGFLDKELTQEAGQILSFDLGTCRGKVLCGLRIVDFHSTSFGSTPRRFPVVGEAVKVFFNIKGSVFSVWAV